VSSRGRLHFGSSSVPTFIQKHTLTTSINAKTCHHSLTEIFQVPKLPNHYSPGPPSFVQQHHKSKLSRSSLPFIHISNGCSSLNQKSNINQLTVFDRHPQIEKSHSRVTCGLLFLIWRVYHRASTWFIGSSFILVCCVISAAWGKCESNGRTLAMRKLDERWAVETYFYGQVENYISTDEWWIFFVVNTESFPLFFIFRCMFPVANGRQLVNIKLFHRLIFSRQPRIRNTFDSGDVEIEWKRSFFVCFFFSFSSPEWCIIFVQETEN
jgi:hypothetical protein